MCPGLDDLDLDIIRALHQAGRRSLFLEQRLVIYLNRSWFFLLVEKRKRHNNNCFFSKQKQGICKILRHHKDTIRPQSYSHPAS